MIRLVGLDDRPPWPLAATGAPCGLGKQLVRPLRGSLVRQVERNVRRDDADEGDVRDVDPLGDQARSDQDVEAALGKGVDDALGGTAMLDDIAIESTDPQRREPLTNLALDALRATAQVANPRRAAGRTARGDRRRPTTVVAAEGRAGLVIDERSLAVRTGLDVTAVAAEDHRRGPPPIDYEDGLVAGVEVERGERPGQLQGQEAAIAGSDLVPAADDRDRR